MSSNNSNHSVSAPCIIDNGILVNKRDMQRLLIDLGRVRYIHSQDGQIQSQGEGYILEVFADRQRSTLVANHSIYLNVLSFDYLELGKSPCEETYFDLVNEGRQLRLIPLSNPMQEETSRNINAAAFDAVMDQVLSSNWDVQVDDDDCPF
ncbi:hypothetical protein AFK68_19165 [Hydrocoleum sp. CS-953]|uniref:hypothetical protein n=1 Tax=Hydrocoleum sp. CS-953 TaxID=1671698 RepID=UPI000B9B30B3|nr:hypothetical protein [Hydrocoleum sp. CS-953]OZH53205.1 hypothetical protein AFK68_19165 [Hydrocoleum sp. CS-953]